MPRLVESLKPIENVHLEQVEAASLLNEKFNNMLASYNNLVSFSFFSCPLEEKKSKHTERLHSLRYVCVYHFLKCCAKVNVLSQQFLVWHQLLAAAERQLGLAADTVEAQQKKKKNKATAEDSPSF